MKCPSCDGTNINPPGTSDLHYYTCCDCGACFYSLKYPTPASEERSATTLRVLTAADVLVQIEIEDDESDMDFDSGDPAQTESLKRELRSRVERGDTWAWCCVTVTATWRQWQGHDCLCGCSYESEADFKRASDYWPDMQQRALDDLNKQISDAAIYIDELREP